MKAIGINYHLDIEVLSPLHVGCGVRLRRNFEWVEEGGITYRLNVDRILEEIWWKLSPQDQNRLLGGTPAEILRELRGRRPLRDFAEYSYSGMPSTRDVIAHIKTVFGQPYLPGSSLKGALRTALFRTMREGRDKTPWLRHEIGSAMQHLNDGKAAKQAASEIEARYGGRDPNLDIFRALQIGDSEPVQTPLTLRKINIVPALDVDAEVIPPGTRLVADARVDTHLLAQVEPPMGVNPDHASVLRSFAKAAQFTAETRLKEEQIRHETRDEQHAAVFYQKLRQQIRDAAFDKHTFFIQVGFATGWRAKSVLGGLRDGPIPEKGETKEEAQQRELLSRIVNDFYLNRGGKGPSGQHEAGDYFPLARHLAYSGTVPALPMGWLKITARRVETA